MKHMLQCRMQEVQSCSCLRKSAKVALVMLLLSASQLRAGAASEAGGQAGQFGQGQDQSEAGAAAMAGQAAAALQYYSHDGMQVSACSDPKKPPVGATLPHASDVCC